MGVAANVLDIQSLEEAHQKVLHTFGKTNILINCAGGYSPIQYRLMNQQMI